MAEKEKDDKPKYLSFISAIISVLPFIIGIILGGIFLLVIQSWGIDPKELVSTLLMVAVVIAVISILIWLAYRVVIKNFKENLTNKLTEIRNKKEILTDKEQRSEYFFSIFPDLAKSASTWFFAISTIGVSLVLVTNITLIATLAVQFLQADRIDSQNSLIDDQNEFIKLQTLTETTKSYLWFKEQEYEVQEVIYDLGRIAEAYKNTHDVFVTGHLYFKDKVAHKISDEFFNPCESYPTSRKIRERCEESEVFELLNDLDQIDKKSLEKRQNIIALDVMSDYLFKRNQSFLSVVTPVTANSFKRDGEPKVKPDFSITKIASKCKVPRKEFLELQILFNMLRALEVRSVPLAVKFSSLSPKYGGENDFIDSKHITQFVNAIRDFIRVRNDSQITSKDIKIKLLVSELRKAVYELDEILNKTIEKCEDTAEEYQDVLKDINEEDPY